MTIPVTICDDSSFARKQVIRALPEGWDVGLTQAAHGEEALQAVRAGHGDILLLDLTMPVLDGFGVLEAIRREDLGTLVIVISGDIQPDSHRRVMALGAVAFIKKPIDAAELTQVLEQYGVLELLTEGTVAQDSSFGFYEWCQEVSNVAMGRAANLLAKVTHANIELSIPKVRQIHGAELANLQPMELSSGRTVSVIQGFIGGGIAGENILLFQEQELPQMARLLGGSGAIDEVTEIESYMSISDVISGAFLRGISEQLDTSFSQGQPHLTTSDNPLNHPQRSAEQLAQQLLVIELSYTIGDGDGHLHCKQLLMITAKSIPALKVRSGEEFSQ